MARATKIVDLSDTGDKSWCVVVYELQVHHVADLIPMWGRLAENFNAKEALQLTQELLLKCSSIKTLKEFGNLSFSDLDKLEAAFREVNAPFLRRSSQAMWLAKRLEINKFERVIKTAIAKYFQVLEEKLGVALEEIEEEEIEKEAMTGGQTEQIFSKEQQSESQQQSQKESETAA